MIDLTPLEVRKKKGDFRRQLRGYDPGQVDDFLDVVSDRLEQLVRENLGLIERVTRLEQQVTEFRDREGAMTEALVTAQQMRDQMRSQVAKEVELAKRQAVQDADLMRSEVLQEVEREQDNLERLRQRQRQLLQSFRAFLERELSDLVVFSKALEFDDSAREPEAPPRARRTAGRGRSGRVAPPEPLDEEESEPEAAGPGALRTGAAATAALTGGLRASPPERGEPAPPADTPAARPYQFPRAEPGPGAVEGKRAAAPPVPPAAEAVRPPERVVEEPRAAAPAAPISPVRPSLGDVSEEEFGSLFTEWGGEPAAAAPPIAEPAVTGPGQSDEEFLDDLLLAEAELVLSDDDVLEEPVDASALEEVAGDADIEEFALDDALLAGESAEPAPPGDEPVELGLLSDTDELADVNAADLGLPPLRPVPPDRDAFGSSGLTLRPLSAEEEAPDVPRERGRDDDDDMFTSLFGKAR